MRAEEQLRLLRRFEPAIRFTAGEKFFPTDAERYVCLCSLWVQHPDEEPEQLVPEGKLTPERLAEPRTAEFGAVHYLKFIDPFTLGQLAAYKVRERRDQKRFRAGRGRLARVGYVSRLADVLFSLTLLARGRVPGDNAAAAAVTYQRMLARRELYCYYGRVVEQDGWIVLQYWYFYPFNDWRSGFFGVNDHEADWEMACVYLYEEGGELGADWVAYSSHDFSGGDLRRRWDDPELEKIGEHPVIYAGAGSHAGYYRSGEYLTELELPLVTPLAQRVDDLKRLWRRVLNQYRHEAKEGTVQSNIFRIPFVDYARGDGFSIGPGQEEEWVEPRLLDPVPEWASRYRGLWGLYARDPVSGEDAPAGPLYNRDGTVRQEWRAPTGWVGLDKVAPPSEELEYLRSQRAELEERCKRTSAVAEEKSRELTGLGVEAAAMRSRPHLEEKHAAHEERISDLSEELSGLREQLVSDLSLAEALVYSEQRLRAGDRGSPRAHLRRAYHPASGTELRFDRIAEVWAAVSVGAMMIGLVALILFAREYLIPGLLVMVSLMVLIEAGFQKRLMRLTTGITVALAVLAALILVYELFWQITVVAVLAAGAYMVWGNLRELWT